MIKNIKGLLTLLSLSFLSACQTVSDPVIEQQAPPPVVKKVESKVMQYSAQAIQNPTKSDILFAQSSLKSLGYPVGIVDGVWGAQSASAIRLFEKKHNLESANGELSSLNLNTLQNTHQPLETKIQHSNESQNLNTIASKINSLTPNKNTPELIITEQVYPLMTKANPYSRTVTELDIGTGIYILSIDSGWYEVETLSKQYGFIKEN